MTQQDLVNRIVAEVMGKLMAGSVAAPLKPIQPSDTSNSIPHSVLTLNEKIITGDLLAEQFNNQTSIDVPTQAIVTPSAHDWLRHNRLPLRRTRTSGQSSPETTDSQWLVVVHTSTQTVMQILADGGRAGSPGWHSRQSDSSDQAALAAVRHIGAGVERKTVVFSSEPEAVACAANRHQHVRAAAIADTASVARVRSGMNCNAFVINPHHRSYFELRTLLRKCRS